MASRVKKVLLKVQKDGIDQWVHLCYIPVEVYEQFFYSIATHSELGAYLSKWALEDFKKRLPMTSYEDIQDLRNTINQAYQKELFFVSGWVRLWITQHMKEEIAIRKGHQE